MLAVAVVFTVHSILVMLWVMPSNPIRDAVGDDRVEAYINNGFLPFEQNWSVFAPTPRRADENIQVRAYLGESGTTTAWFDITADEGERIRYLPNPSRIHAVTRRLGAEFNEMLAEYTESQRDLVASDTPSRRTLAGRLTDDYLRVDEMITRFGTMYATARWGDGVSMVQFRVGHRRVPGFGQRDRSELGDVPFTYRNIGWRTALRGNSQAQAAFDGYVEPSARKVGG